MTDIWSREKRSEVMSKIRARDTGPESMLRAACRRQGIRYRSYRMVVGVKVDLQLPVLHTVILVHGCFWHGCKQHYRPPSDNADYWQRKLEINRARDGVQIRRIKKAGWLIAVVWEHSLRTPTAADQVVERILLSNKGAEPYYQSTPPSRYAKTSSDQLSLASSTRTPRCKNTSYNLGVAQHAAGS